MKNYLSDIARTETELEALDFSELVSVTDEELEHYHSKVEERPALLPASTFRIVPLMLISPSTASVLTVGRPRAMLHSAINVGNASFPVMPMPCKS